MSTPSKDQLTPQTGSQSKNQPNDQPNDQPNSQPISQPKVLLVTGGSRGIGAATALLAAEQGWAVAVNYSAQSQAAQAVVNQIERSGGRALAVQAQVENEAQVLAMFERIDQQLGPIAGLVNNAGVVDVTARLDEMDMARWRRMFDITSVR